MSNLTNEQKAIYAILADNVYWDVRKGYKKIGEEKDFTNSNWTPVPNGWSILTDTNGKALEVSSSTQETGTNPIYKGFTARAYQNDTTKEVVIAFAGTEPKDMNDWLYGNLSSGIGKATGTGEKAHLTQAAIFYHQVKESLLRQNDPNSSNNSEPNITFTGHSLGGGLATVMGIWFDRPAFGFDPAQFKNSVLNDGYIDLPSVKEAVAILVTSIILGAIPPSKVLDAYQIYKGITQGGSEETEQSSSIDMSSVLEVVAPALDRIPPAYRMVAIGIALSAGVMVGPSTLKAAQDAVQKLVDNHTFSQIDASFKNYSKDLLDSRIHNLDATAVKGEVLETFLPAVLNPIIKNDHVVAGETSLGLLGVNKKHSQTLMVASLLDKNFENYMTLHDVNSETGKGNNANLNTLGLVLDEKLYNLDVNYSTDPSYQNFLTKLVRSHIGGPNRGKDFVKNSSGGYEIVDVNASKKSLLVGFGNDLEFLGYNLKPYMGKYTWLGHDEDALAGYDALIVQTIQHYYYEDIKTYTGEQFFKLNNNTIQYKPVVDFTNSPIATEETSATNKAHPYAQKWIEAVYKDISSGNSELAKDYQSENNMQFDDWNLGLNDGNIGALSQEKSQLLISIGEKVTFTGGNKNDLLFGSTGIDNLTGGKGNDTIYGGLGADNYYFSDGDGIDKYFEVTGNDSKIYLNNKQIKTLRPTTSGQDEVFVSESHAGYTFILTDKGTLEGSSSLGKGTIILNDFDKKNNNYGITFESYQNNNSSKPVIYGDNGNAYSYVWGASGNDVIHTGNQRDWVIGNDGRDLIDLGADNDEGLGSGGADTLLGGSGNDILYGGGTGRLFDIDYKKEDNDLVVGGDGNDLILGGHGNDVLIGGNSKNDNSIPNNFQLEQSNDNQGDWINGGEGKDQVWGSGGKDMLTGGVGSDEIHGNAENDIILGDGDYAWQAVSRNPAIIADPIIVGMPFLRERYVNNTYPNHPFLPGYYHFEYAHEFNQDGMTEIGYVLGSYNKNTYLFNIDTSGEDFIFTPAPLRNPRPTSNFVRVMEEPTDGTNENNIDYLYGDDGDDWIAGQQDTDYLYGGSGNDRLYGDDIDSVLVSNPGNDYLFGEQGEDKLYGGKGNDYLNGGDENDMLYGGDGDDIMEGGKGDDILEGGANKDKLLGNENNDTLNGGSGDDILVGGDGDDTLEGGDGDDILSGDDITAQSQGEDILRGGEGNDTLWGGKKRDTLEGGNGHDTYTFKAGDGIDTINDIGENTINLSTIDNKNIVVVDGMLYYNLDETDGFNFSTSMFSKVITANGTYTAEDFAEMVKAIEIVETDLDAFITNNHQKGIKLTGTADVNATGNDGDNTLIGNTGNNVLDGLLGSDTMQGGLGNDTYYVDNLGDKVQENKDEGDDTIHIRLNSDSNEFFMPEHIENLVATYSDSPIGLTGNSSNNVVNANFKDNIIDGGAGNDKIYAGLGNDLIKGSDGSDELYGESGQDNLEGGVGDDYLIGGKDNDVLMGGDGNDTYIFKLGDGHDQIIDSGNNTLDLSTLSNKDLLIVQGKLFLSHQETDSINFSTDIFNKVITADGTYSAKEFEAIVNVKEIIDASQSATVDININKYQTGVRLIGNDNIDATGDNNSNTLIGNSGNNKLDGLLGIDYMQGKAGNDIYVVDNLEDIVDEKLDEGRDTLELLLSKYEDNLTYKLSENVEILHASYQNSAQNLVGNSLDNEIVGNTKNNFIDGGTGKDRLFGGSGDDTYQVDNLEDIIIEDLDNGIDTINTSVDRILEENVENLTLLVGAITGIGNQLNNIITGNQDNNSLDGSFGDDTLYGGLGDDIYYVDARDQVIENENQGNDTVRSTIDWTLAKNLENLELVAKAKLGVGNELNNIIKGNDEDNILDGAEGADELIGYLGNDKYIIDNVNDIIKENVNEGEDEVITKLDNYILTENIENLTLSDKVISGKGNHLNNIINGNDEDNILDGGLGDDTLRGGRGNDTYIVLKGQGNDIIEDDTLNAYGWYYTDPEDKIISDYSIDLSKYKGIEIGQLIGNDEAYLKGRVNISDKLIGNDANNIFYGSTNIPIDPTPRLAELDSIEYPTYNYYYRGDELIGGKGDDTYILYSDSDQIIENVNEGNDTIKIDIPKLRSLDGPAFYPGIPEIHATSTVDEISNEHLDTRFIKNNYILPNNIENLILSGQGSFDLIGNLLNNNLVGNDGNNRIDGQIGADIMSGGKGDDVYVIDNIRDIVFELNNEGSDRVESSISITKLFDNIEDANLMGSLAINIQGNELDNNFLGNTASNIIDGSSGNDTINGNLGNDTLIGGEGADSFVFNTAFSTKITKKVNGLPQIIKISNVDTITDFSSEDKIIIEHKLLNLSSPSGFTNENFVKGNNVKALDSDDYLLYDTGNGKLYFDANGNQAGGLNQIATLSNKYSLTIDQITIV